jgi:hypothetical protein
MKDSQINIVSLKGNWFVYLSLRLDPRISLYSFNVKLFAAQLKINCTSLQIVPTLSRVGRGYIFGKVSSTHSIRVVASPILFSPLFWVWKWLNNISLLLLWSIWHVLNETSYTT